MTFSLPLRAVALSAGLLAATALSAVAAPINGTLGIGGAYQAQDGAGNIAPLASAVAIDFAPIAPTTPGLGTIFVTTSSGDLGGITFATLGSIQDLVFAPFSGPVLGFFSIGGLTFDLESLVVVTQNSAGIILEGTGTMHYAGYDATQGTWGASFNNAGGGSGQNPTSVFSWSADVAPSAVPEPASLALFGAGLLGLGLIRRRTA